MFRRTLLTGASATALQHPALARPALVQPAVSRTLRFVPQSDVTVLDPVVTTAYVTMHHGMLVWDQLYGLDAQLRPQPQMVEGHTLGEDGRRWTFQLRDGLRFHDGQPVRGRDCIASIQRWAQRDPLGQVLLERVAEMAAPDDRSFVIRLHHPYGLMLDALAKLGPPALFIMPERLAATDPAQQIHEIVGSGPFRFRPDERVVGARVAYERNPDYVPRPGGTAEWTAGPKVAHFDRVEWVVMPDAGTATAALRNGEVDWWENPTNDLLPILARDRNVTVAQNNPLGLMCTGVFNHLHPPFDKAAVRHAVLQAMSQDDFQTAAAGIDPSLWRKGVGVFTPGTPMASEAGLGTIAGGGDVAAARKALAAAGYRGERVVLMAPSDNPVLAALGEVCNDLLRRIGMNVDFVVSDWGTLVQRRASREAPEKGGWSMFNTTWRGTDMVNPIGTQVLRCNGANAFFGWPNIPGIETLRTRWLDAPDLAGQRAIASELQGVAMREVPFLPTGQYFSKTAYRRGIEGVLDGLYAFWNVRRT